MASANNPVVNILPPGLSKRKRDVSEEAPAVAATGNKQEAKRRKADIVRDGGLTANENMTHEKRNATVGSSQIREAIESQFSLEILLKHNELRLINQELAKCQIALEQLRRCHLIPYPPSQGTAQSMLDISSGAGPAVQQRHGSNVPQWAPSYGVSDGPYTRHYAKWLIPDPSFDGEKVDWFQGPEASRAGKTLPEGRTTRHSFADGSTPASKARAQRGSASQKLQALSSGYPQPKEKAGPCTLKRMSDGQFVKLVCLDCQRENFSSTQGFINHCRIAHRRDFKSHEEAAVHSGVPIEVDEVTGGIVGEEKAPTVATGLVHPLIRNTSADPETCRALLSRINASLALFNQGMLPGVTSIPGTGKSTPRKPLSSTAANATPGQNFVPSSETPHLSAMMRRLGFNRDLNELVGEAKKAIDLDDFSQSDDSEDSEKQNDQPYNARGLCLDGVSDSPLPAMRVPARATMSPAPFHRPGSAKGIDNMRKPGIPPRPAYTTPIINTAAASSYKKMSNDHRDVDTIQNHVDHEMMMEIDAPSIVDLSPNTVASNNAPSLVSDDGEYDDGDDDAESASEDEGDDNSDVAEIDIEDGEADKVLARTIGSGSKKEDKHVTFVSPVKEKGRARK